MNIVQLEICAQKPKIWQGVTTAAAVACVEELRGSLRSRKCMRADLVMTGLVNSLFSTQTLSGNATLVIDLA